MISSSAFEICCTMPGTCWSITCCWLLKHNTVLPFCQAGFQRRKKICRARLDSAAGCCYNDAINRKGVGKCVILLADNRNGTMKLALWCFCLLCCAGCRKMYFPS